MNACGLIGLERAFSVVKACALCRVAVVIIFPLFEAINEDLEVLL